jgi:MFS family permease
VLGLTEAEAGLATSLFVAGMLVSRAFAGRLTERLGFRPLLAGNLAGLIVMTLLYSFAETLAALCLIRMLSGIFYGLASNTLVTIASTTIPRSRSGEGVGYFSMFQMSAWAFGPYIGVHFANQGAYGSVFLYCTILPLIALVTLPFLRFSRIHKIAEQDDQQAAVPLSDTGARLPDPAHKGSRLEKFIEPAILPIAAIGFWLLMFNAAVISFVTPFSETIHLSEPAAFFFLFFVAGLLGTRPLVSKLFDRKGATFVMVPGISLFAVAFFVLSSANSPFTLLLAAVLVGTGLGACQNSTLALCVSSVPKRRLGFATATFFAAIDLSSSLGPVIAGLLIPLTGYRGMYFVGGIWTLIGLPIYLTLSRKIAK